MRREMDDGRGLTFVPNIRNEALTFTKCFVRQVPFTSFCAWRNTSSGDPRLKFMPRTNKSQLDNFFHILSWIRKKIITLIAILYLNINTITSFV